MDRTKRQAKAAREQQQRNLDHQAEDEVQDLEQMVLQTRERLNAAKAAKSRAAALRQELLELQEEEQLVVASEEVVPAPVPVPAPVSDPGAFVAASLNSAVNSFLLSLTLLSNILNNLIFIKFVQDLYVNMLSAMREKFA